MGAKGIEQLELKGSGAVRVWGHCDGLFAVKKMDPTWLLLTPLQKVNNCLWS